ncbi:hypothetical protein [Inquilinus sp. CAU 1745]|uniref:ComEC/Rec2 family competence protein n=1 Tax=Inquilinus sp. CAU 1745 TaxID=3140369 RepID=UPI00325A4787
MPVRVHFLNVGHGDCTVVEHASGNITLIDLNNGSDLDPESVAEIAETFGTQLRWDLLAAPVRQQLFEGGYDVPLTNPIEFLHNTYPGRPIFRYVQTHPDLDHMRGISALNCGFRIINFWDTAHTKMPDLQDWDQEDWGAYQGLRAGAGGWVRVMRLNRGARAPYYNSDDNMGLGDGLDILSPFPELTAWANGRGDSNELSYVLRLSHAGRSVILGGDAGEMAWTQMVAAYGNALKCDVLKASHHGRGSGYHMEAVRHMKPLLTVVSVGRKPDTDATSKYRRFSGQVASTRWSGEITLTIADDGRLSLRKQFER